MISEFRRQAVKQVKTGNYNLIGPPGRQFECLFLESFLPARRRGKSMGKALLLLNHSCSHSIGNNPTDCHTYMLKRLRKAAPPRMSHTFWQETSCFWYCWQCLHPDLDPVGSFGSFSGTFEPWGVAVGTQRYSDLVCVRRWDYLQVHLSRHLPWSLLLHNSGVCGTPNSFASSWLHSGEFKRNLLSSGNSRPILNFYYQIFPHPTPLFK